MSFRCEICDKGYIKGNNRSHANNATLRRWKPNLQKVRVATPEGTRGMRVCTSCIQAGKVVKASG